MANKPYDIDDVPDFVEEIYDLRKEAGKHQGDWRREAREAYEFRDGNQWDSTDVAILEEQRRPIVTFNRVGPIIDSIVGNEIGNRQEIRYFPRTMGDREANEVYTEAARWVRDNCDAEDEESDAYADAITCGMGWTEMRVDYDEDPDGKIVIERVPPLEMRWDPNSRKANLADAKWLMREKWMDLDDVKDRWPEKKDDLHPQADQMVDNEWLDEHDSTHAWQYMQDQTWYDPKNGKILVIHYQYREREPYYRVGDPETGRVIEFEEKRFNRIKNRVDEMGVTYVKQHRWVYHQAFIAGKTILQESDTPVDGAFSYHCVTAKRDEEHGTWYGLSRAMRDPQKWANKFFSQAMHVFNSNPKGGLIIEDDAVDDKRNFEDTWAAPDSVTWVNDGAIASGKIQVKDMGGYPASLDKLLAFAISSIRDVSGVNLELLGMANREQAGVLEVERKKAALVILAPLLNSLRRYRKMAGRALLAFMREYIPEGTMMRLTDKAVPFFKDDEVVQYDIVVDTAPNSPNLKQEVWAQMQNILPAMVKAGVPIPPSIIRFSPLPESVSDEMIKYIEERSQVDPQMGEKMQQMQQEMQKLQEENKQLADKRQQFQMQMEMKWKEAQLEAMIRDKEISLENKAREMELLWKQKMSDADRAAKLIEIKARYDTEMKKLEAKSLLERDVTAAKIQADKEVQVISLDAAREQKKLEQTMKMEEGVGPEIAKAFEAHVSDMRSSIEELTGLAREAEQRRNIILDFVKKEGGDLGAVAERLR